jgi:hypothetical protein
MSILYFSVLIQQVHTTITVSTIKYTHTHIEKNNKIKTSLLQAVEAPRVARGRGSHIT